MLVPKLSFLALLLVLAPSVRAQASAWVVDDDGGPGVDFANLQDAIDAAAEGDLILIKEGFYVGTSVTPECFACLEIDGKSLTLVAEQGELVELTATTIANLAPLQSVTLRGLVFDQAVLDVEDAAGTVWIEDTTFVPFLLSIGVDLPMLEVRDSAAVHLNRCTVSGASSLPFSGNPGSLAVLSTDSGLHLYETDVAGGLGSIGQPAGDGVRVSGGFFFASGGTLGGQSGLHLIGNAPQAYTLGTTITGAPPVQVDAGTHQVLSGTPRRLEATTPVRVGEVATLELAGLPGDFPIVDFALRPGAFFNPFYKGTYQLGTLPLFTLVLGPLPASGELSLPLFINTFGPTFQGVTVYVQADFFSLPGVLTMGPGTALVILAQ